MDNVGLARLRRSFNLLTFIQKCFSFLINIKTNQGGNPEINQCEDAEGHRRRTHGLLAHTISYPEFSVGR